MTHTSRTGSVTFLKAASSSSSRVSAMRGFAASAKRTGASPAGGRGLGTGVGMCGATAVNLKEARRAKAGPTAGIKMT